MPGLVLELKQDDLIIINGAVIKFRVKTRIEINGKARFLFGKQVLLPHESNSPGRKIYFALQTAYVGGDEERAAGLAEARRLIAAARAATASAMAQDVLDRMLGFAEAGECYEALKLCRTVIRHEEALVKQNQPNAETGIQIEEPGRRQPVRSPLPARREG
jgi:flagellar protein FlbT